MRILLLLLFLPTLVIGQVPELSSRSQIHVVTCGPGQHELYSAFGHSAFRVVDPVNGMDQIYDYGVFDYNQPNFYLNFARGFLNYRVAKRDYEPFRNFYVYYNRYFHEQRLALSLEQKQRLFEYLEWNNQPENQFYSYDYFYDNCATKLKEVLISALGEETFEFDNSHITETKSIRELTDDYLMYQPWGEFGIDICLGLPMDVEATPEIHLFLPEYVRMAFDNAYLISENGRIPLVDRTYETYNQKPEEYPVGFFTPVKVMWIVFIIMTFLGIWSYRKRKWMRWMDVLYFGLLGLLGLFLSLLWFATDHQAAANNLNLLLGLPFHLVAVVFMLRKSKYLVPYFKYSTIWYLLLSVSWFFLPQLMHPALFALSMTALVRSFLIWKSEKWIYGS